MRLGSLVLVSIFACTTQGGCIGPSERDRAAAAVIAATDLTVTLLTSGTLSIGPSNDPTQPVWAATFPFSASCSHGGAMIGTLEDLGFYQFGFSGCAEQDHTIDGERIAIHLSLLADTDDRWGGSADGGYHVAYSSGHATLSGSQDAELSLGVLSVKVDDLDKSEQNATLDGTATYRGISFTFSNETYPVRRTAQR
jgi:hypothetical protein